MSIMFQLFSAEDLKKLASWQYEKLRNVVVGAVENSRDTSLKAAQTIATRIQTKHLPPHRAPAPVTPPTQGPANTVEIKNQDIDYIPDSAKVVLQNRIKEVFQQLTGSQPTGASVLPAAGIPTIDDLLDRTDLTILENRLGDHGRRILESALTCELANFKTLEALKEIKQQADAEFIRLTGGQRPKGPDLLYSPFHPLSPLYPDRPGQNP
jgi:hypothetical protein